jgi:hypothetical protein
MSKDESAVRTPQSQKRNATEHMSDAPKRLFPPERLTLEEIADLQQDLRESLELMERELDRQQQCQSERNSKK